MKLTELYESETGEKAIYRKDSSDYHTLKYVRWLENIASQPVNTDAECQYANLCSPSSVKCTEGCHNHPDNKKGNPEVAHN